MARIEPHIIRCGVLTPSDEVLLPAAIALRQGGLVAFPTETVYGLGANALDPEAVRRIFAAKGRPATNPLIVHVPSAATARSLAAHWPDAAQTLADRLWPGPITLVVLRGPSVPDVVTAGGPTVALRCPSHPVARRLIELADVPVAAPSANVSGHVSPTRFEHLAPNILSACRCVVDAGPCEFGLESTVLDVTTSPPTLLRPGAVTRQEIAEIVGSPASVNATAGPHKVRSPGMHGRHYAPRAQVVLVETPAAARDASADNLEADRSDRGKIAFVVQGERSADTIPQAHRTVVMPDDPRAYGRRLYAVLQELDADGMETIVVQLPPDTPDWEAVRDRLRRAALR